MCSYIIETADVYGAAKGTATWMAVNRVNVCYDHPASAPLDHAILIDFVDSSRGPDARVAVELSKQSAQALILAIQNALETGDAMHLHDGAPELLTA